jgi:uncharacterized protein YbjT (DUF2867 family)
MSRVLVTGGSGTLGRLVVARLADAGHDVLVLSRHDATGTVRVDLRDGSGLDDAVAGMDAIVHCATDPAHPREVDVAGTEHLIAATRRAGGSPHLVYVSIVGVDQIPWSFYAAKRQAEALVGDSGLPWTVQRATQFHGFLAAMLDRLARPPIMLLPRGFRFQPVSPADLAVRLVELVDRGPGGLADDFGGPEVLDLRTLARTRLASTGRRRLVLEVPVPGRLTGAFRRGANLCPEHADGRVTWQQFLDSSTPVGAGRRRA